MIVDYTEVIEGVRRRLEVAGVPAVDSDLQARWLVEAELRGHPSHGLRRLPVLLERLANGLIHPGERPDISWLAPACASVDGRGGLGPPTMLAAIDRLMSRAREQGICLAGVRNCAHIGILAPYVEKIADEELIGIVLTTSEALVHPWGGRERMVGTNPIAIGVPAKPASLVVDLATSTVSMGKVLDHLARGLPLKSGWAVDRYGQPTTDPREAVEGALSPFGGAKGYALGIALEALVSSLTGTALGNDVVGTLDCDRPVTKGDVVVVIDPSSLAGPCFLDTVSSYLTAVRESQPTEANDPVRIPGDGSRARKADAIGAGLEVDDALWGDILRLIKPPGLQAGHSTASSGGPEPERSVHC